jgi:hypothetical protein
MPVIYPSREATTFIGIADMMQMSRQGGAGQPQAIELLTSEDR